GRQIPRPVQIGSLGAGFLLVAHQLFGVSLHVVTASSQNLAGSAADALAALSSTLQLTALVAVWVEFGRGRQDADRLVRASAAAAVAFVAFGKVFSPQYMIWLVPLVPLVRGRR